MTSGKLIRVWIFGVLASFAVTSSVAVTCCAIDRARLEWPLGRGDIAGTGATASTLPEKLELLWELPLGGIGFDATPVIGDNTIFIGDPDGRFFAIDLQTGKEKWQTKTEAGYIAPATYHEGIVYIGDYDGVLRALHAADGKEKWSYKCEMEIDASPTFFGDNLLVTSQDGQLYCLKRETSELIWKYATGDQLRCGPSLAGNRTYLGGCDGKLHVVDVTTGMAIGQPIPLDGPTGSTPSVSGTSIFVPTHGGRLFAFDSTTSKEIWQFFDPKVSQEFENCVATADNLVVATSKKSVFALDIKTGKEQWSTPVRKRSNSSPIIAGQDVVVSVDSRLMVLDLKTGKEKWQYEVKGSIGSPAVSDGKIIVASDKGTVFCFGQSSR